MAELNLSMESTSRKSPGQWIKILVGFGVAILLAAPLYYLLAPTPLPPAAAIPNPNGYDDLVRAGKKLASDTLDHSVLEPEELRACVAANAEALRLAREGLSRDCLVPQDFSPTWMTSHMSELPALKSLARAFVTECRLAELEDRRSDAPKSYLEAVRLGHRGFRGGPIIDALVGLACEAVGLGPLQKLVPNLNAQDCREAIRILETLEAQRATYDQVLKNEKAWVRRAFGWREKLGGLIAYRSLKQSRQSLQKKMNERALQSRSVLVDLAVRAYELEKGARPKSLADLVPAYLKAIPQDPSTGTNLVYRF